MKKIIFVIFLLFLFNEVNAQSIPSEFQFTKTRIENAFRNGDMYSIEDLINNSITMRLDSNLYTSISGVEAFKLLNEFFKDKEIKSFNLSSMDNGTLVYKEKGNIIKTEVDIYLIRTRDEFYIAGLNISNHPSSTAFFKDKKK